MKLTFRVVFPLAVALSLLALALLPVVDSVALRWFSRDLDIRSRFVAGTLQEPAREFLDTRSPRSLATLRGLFARATQDERLYALGICDEDGVLLEKSAAFPALVKCPAPGTIPPEKSLGTFILAPTGRLHVSTVGNLIVVHDMSFVDRRSSLIKRYLLGLFALIAILVSLLTIVVLRLSLRGWIEGVRSLLRGENLLKALTKAPSSPELRPLVKDLRRLVHDLESDQRARDETRLSWDPQALREILKRSLTGEEILVVSNRQPYNHVRKGEKIEIQTPASGLVTALEPVLRACSGTWIAHGSGSADREVVDSKDHVRVPPDNPSYQIRRVWLTKEQEKGYYYGFSNEGLWPLCHIAHVRPTFRSSDWERYVEVNQLFADAVVEEAKTQYPVVLVQDYHFALLPRMVRERLPHATILTFWHIPWPNPEDFGICPWTEEILDGLLGSSIVGFHTRFHCTNFLDTIDRFLEARIERETSTVSHGGKLTAVNPYPISIEWPPKWLKGQASVEECRKTVRQRLGIPEDRLLGVGVDRMDYTKGILERFRAVERLLELEPSWIGKFTFVQIAAPSRSAIPQYRHFESEVRELATSINSRFGRTGYDPIVLLPIHHEHEAVSELFRASELCFVSSLHDGMNLVAKEFVASREDELGVLVLSQFTGAARELQEALLVNPYHVDQCAETLSTALRMPLEEQRARMRSMRGLIQEFNVYRWAGKMLLDAARTRQREKLLGKIRKGWGRSDRSR